MRRALALVLAVQAGACALEAPPRRSASAPIVAGTVDEGDPAVVALLGDDLCTGTLIQSRVVVTAAHCLGDASPAAVFIGTDVRGEGTRLDVVERVAHPGWDPDTLANDVALLLLARPADAAPVRLNDATVGPIVELTPVRLVGFGDTGPANDERGVKREATSFLTAVDEATLRYGGSAAQTCFGDSGGPVFLDQSGGEVLAGVTSYGDPECAIFGVAVRLDAVLNDFIRPYLEAHPDCRADGVCLPDCVGVDPDCGPSGDLAVGQPCGASADCASDLCIGAVDDPALGYCTEPCSSDAGCPFTGGAAMRCLPTEDPALSLCAWPPPTPGAVGAPCQDERPCAYEVCIPTEDRGRICSKHCRADGAGDCPLGYACAEDPLAGDGWFCVPAGDAGGCAVGRRGHGAGIVLLLCYILARLHGNEAHRHPDRRR